MGFRLGGDEKRHIADIEGKMEFFVRKLSKTQQGKLEWLRVHDFDRLEGFADDEVQAGEVVFKLVKAPTKLAETTGGTEILDERPKTISEGYDCYSIYKHGDNSYEWRLCKIISKTPRETALTVANTFLDDGSVSALGSVKTTNTAAYKASKASGDAFYYYLEFEHLKEYGREMWVKRRREDVIFSKRYAAQLTNFDDAVESFIKKRYQT